MRDCTWCGDPIGSSRVATIHSHCYDEMMNRGMTETELRELGPGEIVVNRATGNSYVVLGRAGGEVVAVRHVSVTNRYEWKKGHI